MEFGNFAVRFRDFISGRWEFFILVFLFFSYCSKRVEVSFSPYCSGAVKEAKKLWNILIDWEPYYKLSIPKIESFFVNREAMELFVAKIAYKTRSSGTWSGDITSFDIVSAHRDPTGACKITVVFTVKDEYPLTRVRIKTTETWVKVADTWKVAPQKFIGKAKRLKISY